MQSRRGEGTRADCNLQTQAPKSLKMHLWVCRLQSLRTKRSFASQYLRLLIKYFMDQRSIGFLPESIRLKIVGSWLHEL